MRGKLWIAAAIGGVLAGCPRPVDPGFVTEGVRSPFMDPRLEGRPVLLENSPPPISGGTLLVASNVLIAADADRDRVVVVDRVVDRVIGEIALPQGAEPGRVTLDADGRAHVALRGSGELLTFDPEQPTAAATTFRRAVCPMPRGVAYEPASDRVLVACRGGELAVLDPSGGAPLVTHRIAGGDLRDVVVSNAGVMVSNFRGAQLIEIDLETGRDISRRTPTSMADSFTGSFDPETGEFTETLFQPAVAWRTIVTPSGDVAMVHQRASDNELQTAPGAYYSTGMCDGSIVQSAVTMFGRGGVSNAPNLQRASLAVDVAVDDDGRVAVVNAGNQSGDGSVVIYEASELGGDAYGTTTCVWADSQVAPHVENAISAAFDDAGDLWVQQRDPARLVRVSPTGDLVEAIELGGEPRFDTGHAVFHGNAGRGTACASCHPEGGDDGRTWRFAEIGARRTPSMYGNVTETAPFHWDGDLPTLRELSEVVFTQRMGGPALTTGQVDSLGGWLDRMPPPVSSAPVDRDAVLRGRALFEGEAQCASCHSGGMLTNNQTVDVGTGGAFQVPSLVGLSARLPLMHTGCATTIAERFDVRCGGDRHGSTAHLGEDGIADLVAYLETL